MNANQNHHLRALAVLLPGLIFIVMVVSPLLSQDVFYYKGHFDPKWFYTGYCSRVIHGFASSSSGSGNTHFLDADMYYPQLNDAGFNCTVTGAEMLDSGWYGNIKLFPYTLYLLDYGYATHRWYEVGDDPDNDYFHDPLIGEAGVDPDGPPFEEIIFYCDTASCDVGYVINDTLWAGDHRRRLHYWVALAVKYRNAGSPQDTLLRITIGDNTPPLSDEWCQMMCNPISEELVPPPTTDTIEDIYLKISDFNQEGVYEVKNLYTHEFGDRRMPTIFKLYWYDTADLYLDWIHIYDDFYDDLAINGSAHPRIQDSIAVFSDTSLVEHLYIDEPHWGQFDAVHIMDSLTFDEIGVHYFANLFPWNDQYYHDYIATVNPPMLCQNLYTIYYYTSTKSDTTYYYSIQRSWDRLLEHNHSYGTGFPEDECHRGLLPFAQIADSAGIPWFTIIQAQSEWFPTCSDTTTGYINWDSARGYRDPTWNEIFCEAYLALSCGAKGIGYYHASSSFYRQYYDSRDQWIYFPNPYSPGLAVCRGIFDLVEGVDTVDNYLVPDYLEVTDFPEALNTGFFLPNYKFYAVDSLNEEIDIIDSVLLELDWEESFCTDSLRHYGDIDSVWTSEDHQIDSTFVQVGVFDCNPQYTIDKYIMFVNRRCLDGETRTVHARFDFGEGNSNRCLSVEDYLGTIHKIHCCTNDTGVVEDFSVSLAPGHGKLFRIHNSVPVCGNVDSGDTLTWAADTTVWVVDTLEVEGTLIIEEGATVKVCDVTDGIIVKPEGHLSILGTEQNPVTIEGVNPDSLNAHIKLYGSGTDTIQFCNISNLNWGVAIGEKRTLVLKNCNISHCNSGVVSVGDGTLYMDSCTVDSCNWEGIHLNEGDEGFIKNCTITHNGESGIRLNGVKSTFQVAYNSLEGNNANTDSIYEAIHLYYCSPEIFGNHIENNVQDGVGSYHDSYPVMNKDSETQGDALNRLVNNGVPGRNAHIYINDSAPLLYDGHNDIFNLGGDTTALIVGEKVAVEGTYKIYGNYFGSWQSEPGWAFDMDCDYDWDPRDKSPNTQEFDEGEAALAAFDDAYALEMDERWGLAALAYLRLVRDYPDSYFAQASLDRMLGCYQELNASIPNLQVTYEAIRDSTRYEHLFRKARQMAIRCLVARRQYDQAVSQLEAILQQPGLEPSDLLYALIDIANVHMVAYYDSLICSWDPGCDSVGTFAANPGSRRAFQPVAGIDNLGDNRRRVADDRRTVVSNEKRAAAESVLDNQRSQGLSDAGTISRVQNPSNVAQNSRNSPPPVFAQDPVAADPLAPSLGTYAVEQASYPWDYISAFRPADEEDYRLRVRDLLAQLRGVGPNTQGNGPPPVPDNYFLAQNYPNPFNPVTTISYGLPEASHVKITIYNILGRKVLTLVNTDQPAGYHKALWDSKSQQGLEASSGIYFYRIETTDFVDVKKMVLLR